MIALALFGGVALLLYGIRLAGDALQRAAGARFRALLTDLTRNRVLAVASGALVTAIIQSSSAMTVMLIGFVSAGLMTFPQTLGIILGADIGTTLTVQLIAFRVTDFAGLLIGIGFTITFLSRRHVVRDIGQATLGFGLIFLGLKLIVDGAAPLKESRLALEVLAALASNPFAGVVVGAVVSAAMASSAATIGLVLALASHGLFSLSSAIPVILGANVGTCATALTASIGASAAAKRVATAHIAFKVLGVALILPFIGPFTRLVASSAVDPARQIANAHTYFNVGMAVLFLPFALGQATREALRMGDVVQGMLRDSVTVFGQNNQELLEDVERRDDQLDFLEREIKLFLVRLSRETMDADLAGKEISLITFIGNLENIGDIIDKNLMELARKKLYHGRHFSDAGWAEILEFHGLISKNLERAIAAFAASDRRLAQDVLDQRPVVRQRERELRESHLDRLRAGLAESLETSDIHLDVLTNLKRISSHVTALVYPILEEV